jgi:3-ketosteroid 9alpha-monooxygenase subunit A
MTQTSIPVSIAAPTATSSGSATKYRYPFRPYPTGWYLVATSAEVPVGSVTPLHVFGRDLVVFRTATGQVVVTDAHCPHMGAHLGYGGTVVGETIRCPFHLWSFATDGRCVDVPYGSGEAGPPAVSLACWPVHETSGLVLVHYDEAGRAPTWHMPERAEWGKPGWVGYVSASWRIRMHVQEVAENVPDTAHFYSVHGVDPMPVSVVETDGPVFRQQLRYPDGGAVVEQEVYGLGLIWLRSGPPDAPPGMRTSFLTATTPVDDQHVELRLLYLVDEGEGATELSAVGRAMVDSISDNTARDVPIWEHKVYRDRAPLVAGDGPIGVIRKWARQFYDS